MMDITNRPKHAIVVFGAKIADMPDELRRDSRILFLGPDQSWRLKQQKDIRVVIRPFGIPRADSKKIEEEIKELRNEQRAIRTITSANAEKLQEAIVAELKQLDPPAEEEGGSLQADTETPTIATPEVPAAPAKRPVRNMSQIVRAVYEETRGDLTETWKRVVAEHPNASRTTVSSLIFQARKWFEGKDPAVLARVAAAKNHTGGAGRVNGHIENDAVQPALTGEVSRENPSPDLELSKALRIFQTALLGALELAQKTLPPLIEAVEQYEAKVKALEKSAAMVFQATQGMKVAVDNLN